MLEIKWKNEDFPKYKIDADNLHRMAPMLNAAKRPFLRATDKRAMTLEPHTDLKIINDNVHKVFESGNTGLALAWDDALLDAGSVAAGKDYYLYLCDQTDGTATIKASLNTTFPSGYSADKSRKIGGFHTLCVNTGTIADHALSGYVAGDILPESVWCLNHRPRNHRPEGMTFDPGMQRWVMVYPPTVSGGELASVYNTSFVTGATGEAFHAYKFEQWLARIGCHKPNQQQFVSLSLGSNQGTNIAGGANPGAAGGHVDTTGRRMISHIGVEDACGTLWQWGAGQGGGQGAAAWIDAFDTNDSKVGGQHYLPPNRPLFGGDWNGGAICGSRGASWNNGPLNLDSGIGVRGLAEPE